MIDLTNDVTYAVTQGNIAIASDTNTTGTGVDLINSAGAHLVLYLSAYTSGNFTVSIEESDDDVTYTAVSAAYLIGTVAGTQVSAAGSIAKLGYNGAKRYIRSVVTSAGGANGTVAVLAVISTLRSNPTTSQVS